MTKARAHETAISLRKQGTSITQIAKQLQVSKSTVSYWCRDITLSPAAKSRIIFNSLQKSTRGMLAYTESLQKERQERMAIDQKRGASLLGTLTPRDIFCIGLGLYWGEGYKKGSQEFGFTNSDPVVIIFYLKWLHLVYKIESPDLIARVSINARHRSRLAEIHTYWSHLTKIPLSQFTTASLIKTTSQKTYRNQKTYFGTLRIKVRRGTRYRREILSAIAAAGLQARGT
jgi:hypothetical protein